MSLKISRNFIIGVIFSLSVFLTGCGSETKQQTNVDNKNTQEYEKNADMSYASQYTRIADYSWNTVTAFDADNNELIINTRTDEDYNSPKNFSRLPLMT